MGRINPRGALVAAIVQDGATIAAALESAHVPTLTIALVHLAGDAGLMKHEWRPAYRLGGDGQGELLPAVQAVIRARALEALAAYRDSGCTLPPAPSAETVRCMMDFVAGTAIPEHYVPFLRSAETNAVLAKLGMGVIQVPHYHVAADIAAMRLRAALIIGTSGGFSVGG